jgi:hypothetical protein
MQPAPSPEPRSGLRVRLTDCMTIAQEVATLQAAGQTELAVWRHFLEGFIVDLDALALIIAELFAMAPREVAPPSPPRSRRPATCKRPEPARAAREPKAGRLALRPEASPPG